MDGARTPKLGVVTLYFGVIVVVSGFAATLLGGFVGDKLRDRFPGSYFTVSATSMMIGFPMILLVLWMPFPLAWLFIFAAVFAMFFNTGPTNTILANVTHPAVRASAFALNIFIIHAFGDVISPVIMGWIWDMRSLERNVARDLALATVSVVILMGAVFWFWGCAIPGSRYGIGAITSGRRSHIAVVNSRRLLSKELRPRQVARPRCRLRLARH